MGVRVKDIRELRSITGAGYHDCKKALLNTSSLKKAEEYLRKKGVAIIDRNTAIESNHGSIGSYIHTGNRIGVLVEIRCKTDFVAKADEFVQFSKEIAMQIAAMKPKFISRDDIPLETISKEVGYRTDCLYREGLSYKEIYDKVDAEMDYWYSESCLLEQPYVRDSKKAIKDLMAELVNKVQEPCRIVGFERWEIGKNNKEDCVELEEQVSYMSKLRIFSVVILISYFWIMIFLILGSL